MTASQWKAAKAELVAQHTEYFEGKMPSAHPVDIMSVRSIFDYLLIEIKFEI